MGYSTNFKSEPEKRLVLSGFMGYDFSSSPLNASPNRAVAGKNFINEDGVNRKRNGWNELINFGKNSGEVNGLWQFIDSEGEIHTICHCGNKVYKVNNLMGQENSFTQSVIDLTQNNTLINTSLIDSNTRSYGVMQNNRLYILCGDYLVYVKRDNGWRLERVLDNEDTYVPITTISIDALGANDKTSGGLDEINMLCSKRINKLNVPYNLENEVFNTGLIYYLDTPSIDSNEVVVEVQTLQSTPTVDIVVKKYKNRKNGNVWGSELYEFSPVVSNNVMGTINFEQGKLVIKNRSTLQPTFSTATGEHDEEDRISVTFYCKNDYYANKICNCRFGTLFGLSGATDRLFIAGNSVCKNEDFFSRINDFTYFGDQSTAIIGSDTVSVTGYARLGDSTLAVFKEPSSQESTIYYRSGELMVDNGINKAVFPLRSGSIGEGVISSYANYNLSGDNLVLTPNGIYGIVLASNVATNERYARERSGLINERLTKENLANAVAVVYKNKYYLAVDGKCYIADSRFRSRSQNEMADTFNYEFWYWENVPARVFAVFDNDLYFGTDDGKICKFQHNSYIDKCYINLGYGNLTISGNNLVINSSYDSLIARLLNTEPHQKDFVRLKGKRANGTTEVNIYDTVVKQSDIVKIENNRVFLQLTARKLKDGDILFADNVGSSGLVVNRGYTVTNFDIDTLSFNLSYNGLTVNIANSAGLQLKANITNNELILFKTDSGNIACKNVYGETVQFSGYNGITADMYLASFSLNDYVVAEWYTPVMDLGASDYSKNLTGITVTAETNISSEITVGWETRKSLNSVGVEGVSLFEFGNIDFRDLTFETSDFAKSYSKKVKEKNFNYIQFRIVSINDRDCAVNNIIARYVMTKKNKGVC